MGEAAPRNVNVKQEESDQTVFSCWECKLRCINRNHLKQHLLQHKLGAYICNKCGKKCHQPLVLKRHMSVHTGEKPHECELCGKRYSLFNSLKEHMLTHIGETFPCPQCEKAFSHCDKSFRFASNLNAHKVTHYKHKVYECEICGRVYYSPSGYWNHKRTHKKEADGNKTMQTAVKDQDAAQQSPGGQ
ncbi:hypothetical protein WMY93_010406 [Mugilogobius chulae]|uniref:C2H2-type domain-containing protein n=1 Tax=Mugilogobius chulae TaxID=88201 RepID=A0AAW0PAX2_9GOBI